MIWECPVDQPGFHLTFDDGPSENTDQILDFLAERKITASFFCLGQQIEKYPKTFERIMNEGHLVGNHGYAHLDGWKTHVDKYIEDVEKGYELNQSKLFRPPFGRLTPNQYRLLKKKFKIVMWSLMPGDFDHHVSVENCAIRISKATPRDIIVLHDHKDSDILEILRIIS